VGDIVVVIKGYSADSTNYVLIVWNSELQVHYKCVKIRMYILHVTH